MSALAETPNSPAPVKAERSTSGAGIAAVVLGGASLFMPYFAAVFLVPAALVCSLVALKNKSLGLGVTGLILSGIGVIGIFGVSNSISSGLGGSSSSATHRVTYQLKGTASSASITIENESGGSEQHVVPVPWVKEFQAAQGHFVYLSAQNQGDGQLEATIYVDGQPIQSAETTEKYGIASASGSVR
jgi:ABC-type transport system involved in multi-copper enzyme maturation permease subunit